MLQKIKTVYGDKRWIDSEELQRARAKGRPYVKLYRKDGQHLLRRNSKNEYQYLHLDNLLETP